MTTTSKWRAVYRAGDHGNRVTIEERWPGGPLYLRVGGKRKSLRTRDMDDARMAAHRQVEKAIEKGRVDRKFTLGEVFAAYLERRTPKKGQREQQADQRRTNLWVRFLGGRRRADKIDEQDLEEFVELRTKGFIDGRGCNSSLVPQPVGARTVEADIVFLQGVLNWAVKHRDPGSRRFYLTENPVRGFEPPREKNPRRPVATEEEYRALMRAGEGPTFKALLFLANHTGRRIEAICRLEDTDYLPATGKHGSIRWRAEHDKMGRERIVPCGRSVGRLMRRLVRVTGPLFPGLDRHGARRLGLRSAKRAGIQWPGWHSFRRKWATDRRHLDPLAVARTGGWDDVRTMERCYIHIDLEAMQKVMEGR